ATSDDFFAGVDPLVWFPRRTPDLTFIDGMHLFEFALRDFINAERHSEPDGVIILDDMLPRSVAEAARNRYTDAWTGDVFRVATVLEQYRPDLTVVPIDTSPTGVVLVVGRDPTNTTLSDRYDEILAEHLKEDPQEVPDDILHRRSAADPDKVLHCWIWTAVIDARMAGSAPTGEALAALAKLRGSADYTLNPPEPKPWPPKKKSAKKKAAPPPSALKRLLRG
ncbi:MAG: class I SAM-dependent methyltransferase, partial [Mycobacteriales bacterium]